MLKRLIDGLIFGTGFGVAFVVVWVVAIYFVIPPILEGSFQSSSLDSRTLEETIDQAPPIREPNNFLGSSAIYSGEFPISGYSKLSAGEGIINGTVAVNGKPLAGLKLRLALNGSAKSQWAITDIKGVYEVRVPYGEYKIDGYEFDYSIVNELLPGKISHPEDRNSTSKFWVSETEQGRGLNFRFVDPIIKRLDKSRFSSSDSVVLKWEQYPNAVKYKIQIFEKVDPDTWKSKSIFDWPARPSTEDTFLDLSKYDVTLKPGHYYGFEVQAENAEGNLISETHRKHQDYDFEIEQ
ncbi:fibronectin type III domain-containing protein [Pseudoalteromonas sp. T1lg75]|uniref:fibronectin type III domain-containing protein n=1 Tax=Pseudoalteromonas sp. T1lg75 TaxID=2077102 RepID=UPI000CF63BB1|nr:fibronectin type III domain-containing protein [Pseudoalteromonas sp. T1lg75]